MGQGNLIREISPNDEMFRFSKPYGLTKLERYFIVGKSAINLIKTVLCLEKKDTNDIKSILDLPCGHGRVLRYLKSHFLNSSVTACDINSDGVDFCAKTFGAIPVYSNKNIDKITINEKFDLIWCGSLFTHIDINEWEKFLVFFQSMLNDGGILIFTTHGKKAIENIKSGISYGLDPDALKELQVDTQTTGFGFKSYPHKASYGISISLPSFVKSFLDKIPNLDLVTCIQTGWDDQQDAFAYIKKD